MCPCVVRAQRLETVEPIDSCSLSFHVFFVCLPCFVSLPLLFLCVSILSHGIFCHSPASCSAEDTTNLKLDVWVAKGFDVVSVPAGCVLKPNVTRTLNTVIMNQYYVCKQDKLRAFSNITYNFKLMVRAGFLVFLRFR